MKAHELSAHVHHEDADDDEHNRVGERRTRWVILLSLTMMVGELIVGNLTDSMALTADGWHMGTHVGALGLTVVAYWYARTRAGNDAFSFGTGKVYALAGFTSGILLIVVALHMGVESVEKLMHREDVFYDEALVVAVLGLIVNAVSALMLSKNHHYGHAHHGHDHKHGHDHDHAPAKAKPQAGTLDFNMRAAYIHILADAMTSVFAIAALSLGKWAGLWYFDPLTGIIGGVVIIWWAIGMCRQASGQLLDVKSSPRHEEAVRHKLEAIDDVRVADLHVWELGPGRRSCIVSIVTSTPRDVDYYRDLVLAALPIAHLTIEIHACGLPHGDDVGNEAQVAHRHEH
jgi:cation diffusion facilitator family transporter